jgi:electron transfer flavoprotein alpha subunit
MNVSHVADILSVKHDDASKSTEYTRPIYAGNAILQIKTSQDKDRIGVVSVRTTAFDKATTGGSGAEVEEVKVEAATGTSTLHKTKRFSPNLLLILASALLLY